MRSCSLKPGPAAASGGASPLPARLLPAAREFLNYLEAECGLATNTREAYRRDLMQFGAYLSEAGCRDLAELTVRHVEGFLRAAGQAGKTPSSVARALAAIRTFCRFCVLERLLDDDPSSSVEPPRKDVRLPAAASHEVAAALLAAPAPGQDHHWRRDRALLALLYATGMRAGELAGLRTGDVNFDLGIVRVIGKGRKERIVPVAAAALDRLREYLDARRPLDGDDQPLLASRTRRPLRREDVFRIVRKYVRRASVRGRGFWLTLPTRHH